ncbi:IS3 family transposase [Streptomyces sp. NPDC087659]|uniref:IS3 family transposase n=1 Tax=Streptomyces sp. NPDC087659 TaxID=3365801 RepID=UPI0037F304AC
MARQASTAREVRRRQLSDAVRQVFEDSGGTYGFPKVWLLLVRAGWRVSVNTVARLMAERGLAGRKARADPAWQTAGSPQLRAAGLHHGRSGPGVFRLALWPWR